MWMEMICDNAELITNNIRLTKLNNPDYKHLSPEDAMTDYLKRIEYCESMYQPLDSSFDNGRAFIKVQDFGRHVEMNNIRGYLRTKICGFVVHIHTLPKKIFLTRHGESLYNVENKVGGDAELSP
jgi:hypothetical protein